MGALPLLPDLRVDHRLQERGCARRRYRACWRVSRSWLPRARAIHLRT